MFRLIKLAAYMLLGYTLYELILGISEGENARGSSAGNDQQRQGQKNQENQNQQREPSRPQESQESGRLNISGGGRGQAVPVRDTTGAEHTERVGRGVVSR